MANSCLTSQQSWNRYTGLQRKTFLVLEYQRRSCFPTCERNAMHRYRPGIACDASDCEIGAVLFHRYSDGSERPIANVSKTLSQTQRKYSQIHKEVLAIIFALTKFHHFLYGRIFIVVTDHKRLISLSAQTKQRRH